MKSETRETDVLVIGGGAAGCSAALTANSEGAQVLMAVKGKIGRSGATPLASQISSARPVPGPYAVLSKLVRGFCTLSEKVSLPLPPKYRKQLEIPVGLDHYWLTDQDYMLESGLWLVNEFPRLLEQRGLYLRRDAQGELVTPPGHRRWIAHKAGLSGYQFGEFKRKEVLARGIPVMEETMVLSLLKGKDGQISGAMLLDYVNGQLLAVQAKAIILATGHTNWLSKRATGTREMAANGWAMAARAGAELQNLEIQWFHASDSAYPDSWMRLHHFPNRMFGDSHQSVMSNLEGEVFMRNEDYAVNMPYTIQIKNLYQQVKKGNAQWEGGYFSDYRDVDPEVLHNLHYNSQFYEQLESDGTNQPMECAITWHMSAGGIRANWRTMETDVSGLFIAGPVGGHQLGGIGFATYDGLLAGSHAAARSRSNSGHPLNVDQVRMCEERLAAFLSTAGQEGPAPIEVKKQIRELVWEKLMFVKSAESLDETLSKLKTIEREVVPRMRLRSATTRYNTELMDALDVQDMIDVIEMVARAALARRESRGPHFREDYPFTDNKNWLKYVVVGRASGEVSTRLEPVELKYVSPKSEVLDYFENPYT